MRKYQADSEVQDWITVLNSITNSNVHVILIVIDAFS